MKSRNGFVVLSLLLLAVFAVQAADLNHVNTPVLPGHNFTVNHTGPVASTTSELDELLDPWGFSYEFGGEYVIYGVFALEDRMAFVSPSRYYEYNYEYDYIMTQTTIPSELTGMMDLSSDGTYLYTVVRYTENQCRVFRWLPGDLLNFEEVTQVATQGRGIAVDPATLDIYVSDWEPGYIEKLRNNGNGSYTCINLGYPEAYGNFGLGWMPNEPNGRHLITSYMSDDDDDGEFNTMIRFMNPENITDQSIGYEVYPDSSEGGGPAAGISVSDDYDPGMYVISTVCQLNRIDYWEGYATDGEGSLEVHVADLLTWDVLEGATVEVRNAGGDIELTGTTDASGVVTFDPCPVGRKSVVAYTDGYSPLEAEIIIRNAEETVEYMSLLIHGGGYQETGTNHDWYSITYAGTALDLADNAMSDAIDLPSPFVFYEQEYSQIYVSANGVLSFDDQVIPVTPATIPSTDAPNNYVSALWYDWDYSDDDANVYYYYQSSDNEFIVMWVGGYDTGLCYFEVILDLDENKIILLHASAYNTTWPGDAVVGIENADGTSGILSYTPTYDNYGLEYRYWENAVVMDPATIPDNFEIVEAYPNPFNPTANASVTLPNRGELNVVLVNVLGQKVAQIANGSFNAGRHSFVIDGRNLSSGIYFLRATMPGQASQFRRMVLMK